MSTFEKQVRDTFASQIDPEIWGYESDNGTETMFIEEMNEDLILELYLSHDQGIYQASYSFHLVNDPFGISVDYNKHQLRSVKDQYASFQEWFEAVMKVLQALQ